MGPRIACSMLLTVLGYSCGPQPQPQPAPRRKAPAPAVHVGGPAAGPRIWKCTVCGYIHTGDEPPETCPICGADRSMFVEVADKAAVAPEVSETAAPPEQGKAGPQADSGTETPPAEGRETNGKPSFGRWDPWLDRLGRLHAHPIAVHIPNGVLPVSVGFLLLAALFDSTLLSRVALCNLIVVTFSMPVVLFTGWVDWQRRFGGHMTHVFRVKMICGAIVSATALAAVIWMLIAPEVAIGAGKHKFPFLLLNLAMLAAAATAGFFGGKLVFRD